MAAQPEQFAAALTELERRAVLAEQREAENRADREILRTFFSGLGIVAAQDAHEQLRLLREDMESMQATQVRLQALQEQLTAMEEVCGETLSAEISTVQDPRMLRHEEQHLRTALTISTTHMLELQQRVRQLREEVAALPAVREELELAQEKLAEDRERVRLLDATIEFLQQAKENLATAYMGTIRTRFGYYLSMLEMDMEGTFFVDPDLQVELERQGKTRELAYFSAAQTDLVKLCMRLALVDALFKDQKTIVILDDPFVNLDDSHMEKARVLLHKLAQTHQILYLTCHTSRMM